MELELVTIGNELLLGYTVDTNAAELSRALAAIGVRVTAATTVGDGGPDIEAAIRQALAHTGFVITTGGLGPTRDDITKRTVADMFGLPLHVDETYLDELRRRFAKLGRSPMPESNRSQAEIPKGAIALENRWGTAPGLWITGPLGTVVMLPGVPREMRGLAETQVIPRIQNLISTSHVSVTKSRVLRTTGVPESALAETLEGVEEELAPLSMAYLPGLEGVDLRLTAWGLEEREAKRALDLGVETLRPRLGRSCYGLERDDLAAVLLQELEKHGHTLSTAESCTGGMIAQRITAHQGSSLVFTGSVVAYANEVKSGALDVPDQTIAEHGAVSEEVALAMVRGATQRLGTSAGIAVTGIAGPGGGTADKPVGTVWIAVKLNGVERSILRVFPGGREDVRRRASQAAMDLLRLELARSLDTER